MTKTIYSIIAVLSFQLSIAQSSETKIDMVASKWNVSPEAIFQRFDNRETLLLNGGRVTVKNHKFTNGTIEVDVYANSNRSFAGITFRKQNNNMEEVYMRLHKSNQVDAVQYTPIFNNESNWQLFREYQAMVSFKKNGWNSLRIEVNNKSAEVFVNDEKVMTIDKLRTDQNSGEIGLFTLFSNRFSNFRFTPKDAVENTKKDSNVPIDSTIIKKWEITKSKPYKSEELHFENFLKEEYITVETEASGLLPISKYIKKSSSGNFEQNVEDYIIASTTVHTSNNETKLFSFDYSDRIIVYLNGKAIFKGNNAFRAKGIQYMGHIDINTNKLYLPLEKGANKIHCVVIDKANGWGLIAKLE
ncbi:family 16 glycoside hydrolase [Yeosuana marina]|uniref:family 16 glycoside hydrolase n=1 Tax=Yeosuana marina TaxID=1565536 RepID=UPI0030EBD4EB|tara:strand:+ start:5143 stop:6216 length:1074 start_codon:yes stop_codon:yes gene_type:complete